MTAPDPVRGYQCDTCGSVSVIPDDVKEQYCGQCHLWNTGVEVVANWEDPWAKGTHPVVRPKRLGCSGISHERLGWCSGCPKVDGSAELQGWRYLALGQMAPGYRGALAFCALRVGS